MATIALKGTPVHTSGELPAVGTNPPSFILTTTELGEVGPHSFPGKVVVLNIFPSVDTPTCAASVRRFNSELANVSDTVVLCASADLPFAHKRFCGAEGLDRVMSVSDLRDREFGQRYGVSIVDGPLKGLLARSVVVIGKDGKVKYTQMVPEITEEPDYATALAAVKG